MTTQALKPALKPVTDCPLIGVDAGMLSALGMYDVTLRTRSRTCSCVHARVHAHANDSYWLRSKTSKDLHLPLRNKDKPAGQF